LYSFLSNNSVTDDAKQRNGIHNAFQILLAKLHTNSLLSTLNSRVRKENHGSAGTGAIDSFAMPNRTATRVFVKVEHEAHDTTLKGSCDIPDGKFDIPV
jgi:hypothetical protein